MQYRWENTYVKKNNNNLFLFPSYKKDREFLYTALKERTDVNRRVPVLDTSQRQRCDGQHWLS